MKELALSRELYKPNALPAKAKRSDIMLTMKKKKAMRFSSISSLYISKTKAVRLKRETSQRRT